MWELISYTTMGSKIETSSNGKKLLFNASPHDDDLISTNFTSSCMSESTWSVTHPWISFT